MPNLLLCLLGVAAGTTVAALTSGLTSGAPASPAGASLKTIPEETAGPDPGDGSNGPNVLTDGYTREMASVTGSVAKGFIVARTVGV
jgi:hypothetical protein